MTSDAKIGLLLGLVFIFIIAFIVNGLPSLRSETSGSELNNSVLLSSQNGTPALGDRERRAEATLEDSVGGAPGEGPTVEAAKPAEGVSPAFRYKSPLPETTGFVVQEDLEDIFLKGNPADDSIIQRAAPAGPVRRNDFGPMDPPISTVTNTAADAGADAAKGPKPSEGTELISRSEAAKRAERPAPAAPKTYVVARGDTLGTIAKKFYGAEEGNRIANVQRIFEANKGVLKSADMIIEGQTIVIPALASGAQADKSGPSGLLGGSLFEKVKSVGRVGVSSNAAVAADGPRYEVREGDSLWTIASAQLGVGARYKEIYELNKDVMKDEDSVRVGVVLRIPARR